MTIEPSDPAISGEQKLKAKRSAFWRYVTLGFVLSVIAGMVTGALSSMFEDGTVPIWLLYAAWAVMLAPLAWFTRDYFRRVDELDLMDNLWSHLIGYYVTVWVFGLWYLLYDIGKASEPAALPIMAILLAVTFAAYGARKLGLR